ncbi:ABC transporter ATP-binding protein [Pediococcus ethanolidurans]|uniref:ABC multidrug transporter, ATPase and permease component n=1 Tax=Pediococcus ethanolidurans TaxID=319653 RepID=A0A0R2K0Z1_9LACO|nr:ABC transporter ATP-binding protein [Pediococcus ethanolidurans]KRN83019.1 ABC multidrug transporter, ATPase and permease component [Pediococcus ethanolidurans]GEN94171.1 ABC transporter [Pediococcus ethanolidurans]SER07430.1 ATP-binding cassette, subfamily B [Pediococcus ethanolidurans]
MIKRLGHSVREFKKYALISPVLVAIETFIETFIPYLMANMIDKGIIPGNLGYIEKLGAFMLVGTFISLAGGAGASWYSSKASAGFAKNLRHDLYYHIQDFSFEDYEHFSTSSIVVRLTTDIMNIQQAFQMLIRAAARAPLMLIFSITMAFTVDAQMAMVFVVSVPAMAIGLTIIIAIGRPLFKKVYQRYDGLNRVVRENLRGIRVVKTYNRAETENQKEAQASSRIYEVFSKAERILQLNSPIMQFVMYGTLLFLAWFGSKRIVAGTMQPGQLVSLLAYAMSVLMSLNILSNVFNQMTISLASAQRIDEVLTYNSTLTTPKDALTNVANGDIEFKHVDFNYADDHVTRLHDINLHIKSGETIGIIGETGSGKSTLVQLIPRLYDVNKGKVDVGGQNVCYYDIRTLRDNVSMVLQQNVLFSGTIAENLRWGDEHATDEQLVHAAKLAQADDFIRSLPDGYDTYIEQGGSNVSGGQKQRLTIARALLKRPKILILDDSTSAVDTHTDSLIQKAFRDELPHMTKLIIAQRISSVQSADRIVVLNDGKIEAVGTHNELLKSDSLYQDIYNSQIKGGDSHAKN